MSAAAAAAAAAAADWGGGDLGPKWFVGPFATERRRTSTMAERYMVSALLVLQLRKYDCERTTRDFQLKKCTLLTVAL